MDEENELINSDLEDHSESIETPENSDVNDDNEEQDGEVEQARSELESESEEYSSEDAPQGGNKKLLWTTLKNVLPIKKIATYGIIAAVVIILLAFLISIIGAISHHPYEYIAPRCTQMSVTLGSGADAITDSLSMEQYLVSHIYSATKDLKNVDSHLYKTLAIVLNTQVQSAGICSETIVPKEEDIYDFEVLDQESEAYQTILDAIETETDLVMVNAENESFYQTSLDGFCYNNFYQDMDVATLPNASEEGEDVSPPSNASNSYYTLQQLNYQFPMKWVIENIPDERFYRCPCNFPEGAADPSLCYILRYENEEDEEPEKIYVDGGSGVGISIYGAHYLSSEKGESYQSILKLFYPNGDWTLMSTDKELAPSGGDMVCSKLNFYNTPLSRSEFISRVETYLKNKTSVTATLFRENAGRIYDIGLKNGVNPEMVYIIAEKEQAWKDTDFTVRCFNFYGYGVYNGQNSGKCFNTFEKGVEEILNYVKNKGSLTEFTKVYSYLGTYLANPGSWGDGGCIYLKLPEIYGPNYSRCNSSYRCASSNGGAGCVLTTETEKQAYIDWQSSKILKIRKNIFNLEEEVCQFSGSLDVNAGEASKVPIDQRMNWLFPSGVPKTQAAMEPYLTYITVPIVDGSGNQSTHRLRVHKKLANELTAIFNELANIKFPVKKGDTYGYGWRKMASGTGSLSHHSYGVTIDLNANDNPPTYWNSVPDKNSPYYNNPVVVQIFKAHGFYWGGDWSYKYNDPMHFTYTNH